MAWHVHMINEDRECYVAWPAGFTMSSMVQFRHLLICVITYCSMLTAVPTLLLQAVVQQLQQLFPNVQPYLHPAVSSAVIVPGRGPLQPDYQLCGA